LPAQLFFGNEFEMPVVGRQTSQSLRINSVQRGLSNPRRPAIRPSPLLRVTTEITETEELKIEEEVPQ
jgi:hypothetical protein